MSARMFVQHLLRLIQAADVHVAGAQRGIIYIGTRRGIARKADNPSITRDASGEGVQQALLKALRGDRRQRPAPGRPQAPPPGLHPDVHMTNVRCGGAFDGREDSRGAGREAGC